jgi:multiple sugar transport system substrate-binding protein
MKFIPVILLLFFFGCSSEKSGNVNLTFWAMGAEGESVGKLLVEFEKENPEIKVKLQQIPWSAAQEKLITAYAADMLPDLFQLGNTWIPQFQSLNALEQLNHFVDSSSIVKPQNYFQGIWETNLIDGNVYGIPWYVDTRVLFYRTDVLKEAGFEEPPKTWDELFENSKKVKEVLNDKNKFPIYIPTNEWTDYIIFAMQNGASILKDNNRYGNFSSPNFKEAFEYLIEFHAEGLSPIGISQVTNVYQAFKDNFITMYISGPWNVNEFKHWMKDSLQNCWATAPLPSNNDKYPGISLAGGSSIVINKNTENKKAKAAWKLIEFLSQKKSQIKFYQTVNDLPAVKAAWQDSILANDKYIKAFRIQLENVLPTPKIPEWERIVSSKFQQYVEYVVRGKMSVEEALKKTDEDANDILEKRRWILEKYGK